MWAKRLKVLILVLSIGIFSNAQEPLKLRKLVIDPGHGGKDPGAVGEGGLQEKDVVLDVSIMVRDMIKEKYGEEVEIIMTRDKDEFVGLQERANMANKAEADLFISIHANAAANKSAKGTETFVLGLHKSAAALEVAKRENSTILMEEDHEAKYQDFDPTDPDAYIGLTLMQSAFLQQSLNIAAKTQDRFTNSLKRPNRGVKQAGFLVLYKTTMPSILIELGFVTHKDEAVYLASDKGKKELAESIVLAFSDYKKDVDGVNASIEGDGEVIQETVKGDEKESVEEKNEVDNKVYFKVQIATSSNLLPLSPENFSGLKGVDYYQSGTLYKYTFGKTTTFEKAKALQSEAKEAGFNTAFIVAFLNGERIDLQKALELASK